MTTDPEDEMDAIEALLPWYAAGTLDPRDAERVDAALARRPELLASLERVREDRDETIAINEGLGAPSGAAWARVLATARAEPRRPGLMARFAALAGLGASGTPTRLAWAGAAAAVVILLQAAAIVALLPGSSPPSKSEVATGPGAHAEGAMVVVAFAPDARLDQLGDWLQQHHASIVAGPLGGGLYRVRVGDKVPTPAEMSALLGELGKSPIVRMALPSTGD